MEDERTGDGKMLKALVRQTKKSINGDDIDALYGDGGYDSKDNFNLLDEEGIKAVIKSEKELIHKSKGDLHQEPRR